MTPIADTLKVVSQKYISSWHETIVSSSNNCGNQDNRASPLTKMLALQSHQKKQGEKYTAATSQTTLHILNALTERLIKLRRFFFLFFKNRSMYIYIIVYHSAILLGGQKTKNKYASSRKCASTSCNDDKRTGAFQLLVSSSGMCVASCLGTLKSIPSVGDTQAQPRDP